MEDIMKIAKSCEESGWIGETMNELAKQFNVKQNILVDSGLSFIYEIIKKGILSIAGLGITLSNNEIKDIMKVIKSFENRGHLLKRTIRKNVSQEEGFLNFFLDH